MSKSFEEAKLLFTAKETFGHLNKIKEEYFELICSNNDIRQAVDNDIAYIDKRENSPLNKKFLIEKEKRFKLLKIHSIMSTNEITRGGKQYNFIFSFNGNHTLEEKQYFLINDLKPKVKQNVRVIRRNVISSKKFDDYEEYLIACLDFLLSLKN